MAFKVFDRVKVTTTTTGTGAYALGDAAQGHRALDGLYSNNDTTTYVVENGTDWEVGIGTWLTGNTLARTVVLASTNANAAVSWAAGSKNLSVSAPAAYLVQNFRWAVFTPIDNVTIGASGNTLPVLSGDALMAMGHACVASATSSVAFGASNTAAAEAALAGGGIGNLANAIASIALGGQGNTANGDDSACIGGKDNSMGVALDGAVASGGSNAYSGFPGFTMFGGGEIDAEFSEGIGAIGSVVGVSLNSASGDELVYKHGSTATTMSTAANSSYVLSVLLQARQTDGSDHKAWRVDALLATNGSNVVSVIGTITPTVLYESAGATTWDCDIVAGSTPSRIRIMGYGQAGADIEWSGTVIANIHTYYAP